MTQIQRLSRCLLLGITCIYGEYHRSVFNCSHHGHCLHCAAIVGFLQYQGHTAGDRNRQTYRLFAVHVPYHWKITRLMPSPRRSLKSDVGKGRRREGGGGSRRRPRRGRPSAGTGREADPGAGTDEADPSGEEDGSAAGAGRRGHRNHGQEHRERVSIAGKSCVSCHEFRHFVILE